MALDDINRLVDYCLVLDLVHSLRNIEDILDGGESPLYISFPFAEPDDWSEVRDGLPCPVRFSAGEASLAYANTLQDRALPRANPLVYRSFVSVAEKLSLMLAEEISLAEAQKMFPLLHTDDLVAAWFQPRRIIFVLHR